ncbi:MAG: hypothetical protein JXR30_02705 [Alphaproteobacteria bacterium]|nr:hypothetical protein [Alphaproteobacteria bacterium]
MKKILSILSFFTSGGLLAIFAHVFCCGIPALLSLLGGGAVAGGLAAGASHTHWIEEFREPLFVLGGIFILLSFWSLWKNRHSCPIDSNCAKTKKWSKIILILSVIIYSGSLYSAYFYYPACSATLPPLPPFPA